MTYVRYYRSGSLIMVQMYNGVIELGFTITIFTSWNVKKFWQKILIFRKKFNTIITRGHKQITLISKEWYQRTLCSEGSASFLVQKNLLIEYHRNLSTGFIIEPFFCVQINRTGKKLFFLMFKEITLKRRSSIYKLFNSLDFSET